MADCTPFCDPCRNCCDANEAMRKELSQAKADLAKEREGKCDWHLPSCHVFAQEQKARAEAAEAERDRMREALTPFARARDLHPPSKYITLADLTAAKEALTPPQSEKPKCPEPSCAFEEKHDGAHLPKSWNFEDCPKCRNRTKRIGEPCGFCANPKPAQEDGNNG